MDNVYETLLREFITPLENQRALGLRQNDVDYVTQKKLAFESGLTPSSVSNVFSTAKNGDEKLRKKNGGLASVVLNALRNNWEVQSGKFKLIGIPKKALEILPHSKLDIQRVSKLIFESDAEEVCIIDTYTKELLIDTFTGESMNIESWLKQGKTVKLLFLDPTRAAMRLRTVADLGMTKAGLSREIIDAFKVLLGLKSKYPELHIRLFNELPGTHAILLKGHSFFGLHYSFGLSHGATFFEVTGIENNHVETDLNKHFDTIWSDKIRSYELTEEIYKTLNTIVSSNLDNMDEFFGKWDLYIRDSHYQEIRDTHNIENNTLVPNEGYVSRYGLEIEKTGEYAMLKARLIRVKNTENLKCDVFTQKLGDSLYAHFRFSDHKQFAIHISIRCYIRDNQPVFGLYTLLEGKKSSSGIIMMHRNIGEFQPMTLSIASWIENKDAFNVIKALSSSEVAIPLKGFYKKYIEHTASTPFPFKGKYKIYSYGKKKDAETRGIRVNCMIINEVGFVTYENQRGIQTFGRAFLHGRNLHIYLNNNKEGEKYRSNHIIIHVGLDELKDESIYGGILSGLTWNRTIPLGKRIIVEYISQKDENIKAAFIALHTEEFEKLNVGIRRLMSGRVDNMIAFLRTDGDFFTANAIKREAGGSIQFSEIFYHASLSLVKSDIGKALVAIDQAIKHGFKDIEQWNEEIERLGHWDSISKNEKYISIVSQLNP